MPDQRGRLGLDVALVVLIIGVGACLAYLSVARFRAYNAGMQDLGNMAQSIWSVTQGRPLEFTFRNGQYNRLAHHVEVVYLLLAPLYALFPSPITLLIVQSFLFASAGYPLFRLARRRFRDKRVPFLILVVYFFYPVAQTAVLFDFHGDTLAMPLLIYALEALDRRAWKTYGIVLAAALMCKFYVSVSVVALGIVLYFKGQRRVGMLTAVAGLLWGALAFLVIRPAFRPVAHLPAEATGLGYARFYFGEVRTLLSTPGTLGERLVTAFIVFVPSIWLGRYALVWYLPALAVAVPALLTAGKVAAFDYRFHHYALTVPWLMMAVLEGADSLVHRSPSQWRSKPKPLIVEVAMQAVVVLVVAALTVDVPINPLFWTSPPGWGSSTSAYGRTSRDRLKDIWLDQGVEEGENAMASFFLASHLPNRRVLYLPSDEEYGAAEAVIRERLDQVDVAVLDALFDYDVPDEAEYQSLHGVTAIQKPIQGPGHPKPVAGGVLYDSPAIALALEHPDFALIRSRDGLLMFRRSEWPEEPMLAQTVITRENGADRELVAEFGSRIGLVDFEASRVGDDLIALQFDWLALTPLAGCPPHFAVSRIIGIPDSRIVHLPTQVLLPTSDWSVGQVVRERFEVRLPERAAGRALHLAVGWYDSGHWAAAWTDARSRLGAEFKFEVPLD